MLSESSMMPMSDGMSAKTMEGFEAAWAAVNVPREGEGVSPELRPRLADVYRDIAVKPFSANALKASFENLLTYLLGAGRTNANCWAVDLFFCVCEGWSPDWTHYDLPEPFNQVIAMMGEALNAAVRDPELAGSLNSLPEQILEAVRQLPGDEEVAA
jgi:hypothetical protein